MNFQKLCILLIFLSMSFINHVKGEKYLHTSQPITFYWGVPDNGYIGHQYLIRWYLQSIPWYLNENGAGDGLTFNQTLSAVTNAFNSWENITTSTLDFSYQSSTSEDWGNDGLNVLFWAEEGDDIYSSYPQEAFYALTYITIDSYQHITEVDIIFIGLDETYYGDPNYWKVDGNDTDIEAIAVHEIGHMIGLAHTEVTSSPYPTMKGSYFGTSQRSLETDDKIGASFLYGGNLIDTNGETLSDSDSYFDWDVTINSGVTMTVPSGYNV